MTEAELYKELGILTKDKDRWKEAIPYVSSLLSHDSVKIQAKALWLLGEMGLVYPQPVQDAVPIRWEKKGRNDACGMGVFYIAYQSQGIPSYSHDSLYINNSRRSGQCQFVLDCAGYVPTATTAGSLLDMLFYYQF